MSFTLSFPGNNEAESYTMLQHEHEVYEAVVEETRKAINDMGSDGYELVWPDDTGYSEVEIWLNSLSEDMRMQVTGEAHERGVEKAVTLAAPQIFKELWIRYPASEKGIEDLGTITTSKLPDGTKIQLEEV